MTHRKFKIILILSLLLLSFDVLSETSSEAETRTVYSCYGYCIGKDRSGAMQVKQSIDRSSLISRLDSIKKMRSECRSKYDANVLAGKVRYRTFRTFGHHSHRVDHSIDYDLITLEDCRTEERSKESYAGSEVPQG